MAYSEGWLDDYMESFRQAKEAEPFPEDDPEVPDTGPEKALQAKCLHYCQDHGYPVYHDWSRKRNQRGWMDLFIFLPEGRVELIELKGASGKLRTEQQQLHRNLMFLGHRVHVVKSFKRFLEIMKGDK